MDEQGYVYGVQMPAPGVRAPTQVMGPMSSRRVAEQFCGGDLTRLRRRRVYSIPPWEEVPTNHVDGSP